MKKNVFIGLVSCSLLLLSPMSTQAIEEASPLTSESSSSQELLETTDSTVVTSESSTQEESTVTSTEISDSTKKEQPMEEIKAVEKAASQVVQEEVHTYISLKVDRPVLFSDKELSQQINNDFVVGQTFLAKEKIMTTTNDSYYGLFNHQDQFVGYIAEKEVDVVANEGGVYQSYWKYASVTNPNVSTYSNFSGKVKGNLQNFTNQTLRAKGKYHHFDGTVYYSLYDNKDHWLGYVTSESVEISDSAQGKWYNSNQYITIRSGNYTIWQNFSWQKKASSSEFLKRTFIVKGEYHHFNGDTYYSLYDSNNKWYGYINQSGTTKTASSQGDYVDFGKYVTVKNSSGSLWNNFSWEERQSVNNVSGQTFLAKGVYYHANGSDYYSLYDNNNKWQGYINKGLVSVADGPQGVYQSKGSYVSVTNNNYTMWQNFNWKEKGSTRAIYQKTLLAKGEYKHFNGSIYYSLYDNQGKWYGYVNRYATQETNRTGHAIGIKNVVTVASGNYDMWQNLEFSARKGTTKNMVNKPYEARYKYEHFNGSTYYSLYDSKGKWQGYLNKNAVKEAASSNSTYVMLNAPQHNQNDAGAPMGCEAASLLQALQLKGFAMNYKLMPFLKEMPVSKEGNPHKGFGGSPFVVTYGIYQSIFPKPLTDWANDYAKGNAVDITGTSFENLSKELEKGNPMVIYVTLNYNPPIYSNYFWGRGVDNAHVVTLDGYNSQTNQYHVSDPNSKYTYWVNGNQMKAAYNANDKRAVVIR